MRLDARVGITPEVTVGRQSPAEFPSFDYRGGDAADDSDPLGFEKKPKYRQIKKKMKWGMERAPLTSGVKTTLVPRSGTDTLAK